MRDTCFDLVQNMDLPVTAGSPVYSYLMSPHMQDPDAIFAELRLYFGSVFTANDGELGRWLLASG